jgi:Lsr2
VVQRIEVRLTDDLTGRDIPVGKGKTVAFSLDGRIYEIDLTTKNAAALRTVLRPYIDAGRTVNRARRRPTRTKITADTRSVKEWARANGHQVRDRGRVPSEIVAAFEAAN